MSDKLSVDSQLPSPISPTFGAPLGFATQLRGLQNNVQELLELIRALQQDNLAKDERIRALEDLELLTRIETLERANEATITNRTEATARVRQMEARHDRDIKVHNDDIQGLHNDIQSLQHDTQSLQTHHNLRTTRRREAVSSFQNLHTQHQEAASAFQQRTSDMQADDLEGVLIAWGTTVNTVMNHHQAVLHGIPRGVVQGTYGMQGMHAVQAVCPYPVGYTQFGHCVAHQVGYPCRYCGA